MKFGFVILHYLAEGMTVECVETLNKTFGELKNINFEIVIVDNASPDGSGERLKSRYNTYKNIVVLNNKENMGFAKGNNIGYSYLREVKPVDFIIILNNDVLITQNNFLEEIERLYKEKHFAVMGPDIYASRLGYHQNPARIKPLTKFYAESLSKRFKRDQKYFFFYYFRRKIFVSIMRLFGVDRDPLPENDYKHEHFNIVLHGSCFIFSNIFIKQREYAFNPNTFMYFEEDILEAECKKSGLLTYYSPLLKVEHRCEVSTLEARGSRYQYEKYKNKLTLESINLFLDIINEV